MTGNEVGIDLGLTDLIITSDGYKFKRISKRLEKTNLSLKRSQRKLARKTIGSKNYEKKKIECAKKYAKITRIRNDYYHNVSNYLVSNYDAIYTEDLNVNGMMKNRKLARVIQEASWSTLVGMIAYKANWSGKTFHKIDRFVPSSKTCSHCGHKIEKLSLDVREWDCPQCHTHHDRDINAAINIKNFGQQDCYDTIISSDGTSDVGVKIPMRLMKFVVKNESSRSNDLVDDGISEAAWSLAKL